FDVQPIALLGDRAIFLRDDGEHGLEPWITDFTVENTHLIEDIEPLRRTQPSWPNYLGTATDSAGVSRALYVITEEEVPSLWATDGTPGGTSALGRVFPYTTSAGLHGVLYFGASDGQS